MRGTLRQRSPGSWELRWKEQDPVTGVWKDHSTTFRGTKKQADAKMTDILNEINNGSYVEPSRITVREFLERRLRDYVDLHVPKENTRIAYRVIVNSHLIPALGAIQLAKLTPTRIQTYYREKLTSGRLKGKGKKGESEPTGKPLSAKTVHNHHLALHKALECAVKWGLVARNACDAAGPPKKSPAEMTTWTPAEVVKFLETAKESGNRYYPLFAAAIYTGSRLGELLGARWSDLDLDAGTLVFTIPDGGPINGDNLRNQTFARLVTLAGVRKIRPHDLRHCYASTLLAAGVPLKTVSELMGHSSVSVTGDIYGHLTLDTKREAVNKLGKIFAAGATP